MIFLSPDHKNYAYEKQPDWRNNMNMDEEQWEYRN
jgi:hypothetical protein